MSTSSPWISIWVVSIEVIDHGRLVGATVIVHPTDAPRLPWQSEKLALVIVASAALSTLTLKVVARQDAPAFSTALENPKLPESILPSEVPTGVQLAADATDGNANAHTANAAPKSNKLFFETIFNI
jgi:hypothetical protein